MTMMHEEACGVCGGLAIACRCAPTPLTPSDLERLEQCARGMTPGKREFVSAERGFVGEHCPVLFPTLVGDDPTPLLYVTNDDAKAIAALDKETVEALLAAARREAELREAVGAYFAARDDRAATPMSEAYWSAVKRTEAAEFRLRHLATTETP